MCTDTPRGRIDPMNPLIEQHLEALLELCRSQPLRRLDLFGSAASERFDPETSDLDFVVELEDLEPMAFAEAYFDLLAGLEDLFARPVDLVVESAIKNPYFRESLEQTRTRLYAA
jgi:predicted nucleotidyltransferase